LQLTLPGAEAVLAEVSNCEIRYPGSETELQGGKLDKVTEEALATSELKEKTANPKNPTSEKGFSEIKEEKEVFGFVTKWSLTSEV